VVGPSAEFGDRTVPVARMLGQRGSRV